MRQIPEHLKETMDRYLAGMATPEETKQLNDWWYSVDQEEIKIPMPQPDAKEMLEKRMWNNLQTQLDTVHEPIQQQTTIPLHRRWWVAASIFLMVGAGAFWLLRSNDKAVLVQQDNHFPADSSSDIAPGGNKAILTLANGQSIVLDSAGTGTLAQQGSIQVVKQQNGIITYNGRSATVEKALYNTISTPRGGQYQIVLSDGTKVWLNAASSLRYPTSFIGNERLVELSGEGYFEVAKDIHKKFIVKTTDDQAVEVLGTHFNIKSYYDEPAVVTTLLEGSVRLVKGTETALLKPGQEGIVANNVAAIQTQAANTAIAVAWKDGYFKMNEADIKEVMRQIARWYDVQVSYQNTIAADKVNGTVARSMSLSNMLRLLNASGIKCQLQGRTIVVN